MPKTDPEIAADLTTLTSLLGGLLDLKAARAFDGHIVVTEVKDAGSINAEIRHAHDDSVVLRFSVAVAL